MNGLNDENEILLACGLHRWSNKFMYINDPSLHCAMCAQHKETEGYKGRSLPIHLLPTATSKFVNGHLSMTQGKLAVL